MKKPKTFYFSVLLLSCFFLVIINRSLEKLQFNQKKGKVTQLNSEILEPLLHKTIYEFNQLKPQKDSGALINPFGTSSRKIKIQFSVQPSMPQPAPPRLIKLKGTVGNQIATIIDSKGIRQLVRVGDWVDSASVLRIEQNRVTLKDRAGLFEIRNQE